MTKHYQIMDCSFAPTCVGAFSNEERKVPFSKAKGELCELIAFTGTILFLGFSTSQKSSCLFMSLHFFWAIPSLTDTVVHYKSLDLQLIHLRLVHPCVWVNCLTNSCLYVNNGNSIPLYPLNAYHHNRNLILKTFWFCFGQILNWNPV